MEHTQCLIQLIFTLALQRWEIGLSVPVLCRAVGACCSGSCSADSSGMKKNSATSPSSAAASAAAASAAVSAMAGYDLTNPHSLLVAGNPETLGMMPPPPPHHHQHMQHQHQVKRCTQYRGVHFARLSHNFDIILKGPVSMNWRGV